MEGRDKVVIFAFSGHGCSKGQVEHIYTNDGETLDFKDEVVFPLTKHKHVPKLFCMDACRGDHRLTKGSGATKAPDKVYFEKGVEHVEGNYHLAYATIPYHVSYMDTGGSMWMPRLARALRKSNDSYQNIVETIQKEVNEQLSKKQCQSVSNLNTGPLYLKKRGRRGCPLS